MCDPLHCRTTVNRSNGSEKLNTHFATLTSLSRHNVHDSRRPFTEDADVDHLVKNAADLVAATHLADDHMTDVDHSEPFVARGRLADLAQAAQSSQSIHAARRTDHVDSHIGARP